MMGTPQLARGPATSKSMREIDLPGETHRPREEAIQRIHGRARIDERLEELLVGDLRIEEGTGPDEILPTEVLDQRMIRIDAGRRPLERFALESHLAPRSEEHT